jgi:hypothetical protein
MAIRKSLSKCHSYLTPIITDPDKKLLLLFSGIVRSPFTPNGMVNLGKTLPETGTKPPKLNYPKPFLRKQRVLPQVGPVVSCQFLGVVDAVYGAQPYGLISLRPPAALHKFDQDHDRISRHAQPDIDEFLQQWDLRSYFYS